MKLAGTKMARKAAALCAVAAAALAGGCGCGGTEEKDSPRAETVADRMNDKEYRAELDRRLEERKDLVKKADEALRRLDEAVAAKAPAAEIEPLKAEVEKRRAAVERQRERTAALVGARIRAGAPAPAAAKAPEKTSSNVSVSGKKGE